MKQKFSLIALHPHQRQFDVGAAAAAAAALVVGGWRVSG